MILQLFKWFVKGLLLAACFAGGYYWSLSLKPDSDLRDAHVAAEKIRDAGDEFQGKGSTILDAGVEMLGKADEMRNVVRERAQRGAPVTEAGLLPEAMPAIAAEADRSDRPEDTEVRTPDPSVLNLAMRNHIEALRALGR